MKAVLQRVTKASVKTDGNLISSVNKGYLILLGITNDDTKEKAEKLADKILKLRVFEDENGKTNLSLNDVDGEILIVSQFTLYADIKKGNRPSFTQAAHPSFANELYEYFIKTCKTKTKKVKQGVFGADMDIEITADGPFTLVIESENI